MANGNITTEQTIVSIPGQKKEQGQFFIASEQEFIIPFNFRCYGIETGSKKVNFGYQTILEGETLAQLFKDSILSSLGTLLAIHNMDHNSSITSEVTIGRIPTVTANGTLWFQFFTQPNIPYYSGEEWGARAESFILAPSSQYLLCFNDLSIATNRYGIKFGWFEID